MSSPSAWACRQSGTLGFANSDKTKSVLDGVDMLIPEKMKEIKYPSSPSDAPAPAALDIERTKGKSSTFTEECGCPTRTRIVVGPDGEKTVVVDLVGRGPWVPFGVFLPVVLGKCLRPKL